MKPAVLRVFLSRLDFCLLIENRFGPTQREAASGLLFRWRKTEVAKSFVETFHFVDRRADALGDAGK